MYGQIEFDELYSPLICPGFKPHQICFRFLKVEYCEYIEAKKKLADDKKRYQAIKAKMA